MQINSDNKYNRLFLFVRLNNTCIINIKLGKCVKKCDVLKGFINNITSIKLFVCQVIIFFYVVAMLIIDFSVTDLCYSHLFKPHT